LNEKVKTSLPGLPVEPGTASQKRAFTVVYILWINRGVFSGGSRNMSEKLKYIPALLQVANFLSLIPYRIRNYMYYTIQALRPPQKSCCIYLFFCFKYIL
jgi:hypothetical protein